MTSPRAVAPFTLCILSFIPIPAGAAGKLETVTVTATRFEQAGVPFPGGIQVIDAAAMARSGASRLTDVLRSAAGLQIADLYGEGSRTTVSMRGFGANAQANTLILVDGRRLNNADLSAPDLNSLSLKDVQRVEILRGSAGALYGDEAVGGLINIITRRPTAFRLDAEVEAGSYRRRAGVIRLADHFENGLSYRLSVEKRWLHGYRDHNAEDYLNLLGAVHYDYAGGHLFAEYQYTGEDLQTPGALFADQMQADRRQAANPGDYINTGTRVLRAGLEQRLTEHWHFRTGFTRRRSHGDGVLSVAGTAGNVVTDRTHYQLTPRLVGRWNPARGAILATLGADLNHTDFSLTSVLGAINNRQTRIAVYGQLLYPLTGRLTATLGARHATVSNRIDGALLPPGTSLGDDVNAVEAGLSYTLVNGLRLFARFDTNFRFVLADEYTSASFGGEIPKTQIGRSYEAGLDWRTPTLAANLGVYRLDLDNEIDFDPLRFINTNIGATRRRGVSLNASWQATDRLSLAAAFSYVDAGIVGGPLTGLAIPFVAAVTGSFNADYRFNHGLRVHAAVHGIGKRTANGDFFNRGRPLPGHVTADIYLAWRRGPWGLGFKVNNLLDKKYSGSAQLGFRPPAFAPETAYFPAPGRNFLLTLQYRHD
jgi:iron complex outermembrane receptor protein